jgi:hypothetical protein
VKIITGRRLAIAALAAAALLSVAACSQSQGGGAAQEAVQSGQIQNHYEQVQPPYEATGVSEYRANLNYAEASQVLGINTTSFFFNLGQNTPFFSCPSHGGAVPNTAQLTNPQQVQPDPNASAGSVLIGNMDPNGVYSPTASSGTYVMCVNSAGQEYLVYWEGDVLQVNGNATWNASLNGGRGGIQVVGAPQMPVCHTGYYKGKAATLCAKQ